MRKKQSFLKASLLGFGLMLSTGTWADIPEDYTGTPFTGEPIQLPGQIDCIYFDKGGKGISWNWNSDAHAGGDRPDGEGDVDFCWGGIQLGWLNGSPENWAKYTVHFTKTGDFDFKSNGVNFRFTFGDDSEAQEEAQTFWEKVHVEEGDYVLKIWYPSGSDAQTIRVTEWEEPKTPEELTAEYAGEPFNGTPFEIPGTIPCEQFDKGGDGVAYEWASGSSGYRDDASFAYEGGIGWTGKSQYVIYTVDIQQEGYYHLINKCHGTEGGAAIKFSIDYVEQEGVYSCFTGGRDGNAWLDRNFYNVFLPAGQHLLKMECANNGFDIQSLTFEFTGTEPVEFEAAPYGGTPQEIPGKIEFENFDEGGPGVGFNWQNLYATADTYRPEIYFIGAGGTGHNVGWNDSEDNDWLQYTVNVTEDGEYSMKVSAANGKGDDGIANSGFAIEIDGEKGEKFVYGESNGWDTYLPYEMPEEYNVQLRAGEHQLKVYFYGTNADYIRFTKVADLPVIEPEGIYEVGIPEDYEGTPFTGEPIQLPGQIDCIFFDKGGRGIAFDWNDGVGGGDRPDGEGDVNFCWGGIQLGWLNGSDQNWCKYTVHVNKSTYYNFKSNGVNFRFTFDSDDSKAQEEAATMWEKVFVEEGDYVLKIWYPSGSDAQTIRVTEWEEPKTPEELLAEYAGEPYNGTRFEIPGTIPCEQFDLGGDGVAYEWASGSAGYREDASFAYEGGIGWTGPNQFVIYSVSIAQEGYYKLVNKCHGTEGHAAIKFEIDFIPQEGIYSCFTGGRDGNAWLDRNFYNVYLPAGEHLLKMVCDNNGFDIQSLTFEYIGAEPVVFEATPFGGTPQEIPGKIELENFDDGGLGVGFNWQNMYATADTYRPEIYFIGTVPSGGNNIGWNDDEDNDWLQYTVNVKEAGVYAMKLSAANGYDRGAEVSGITVEVDGVMGDKFVYGESNGWDTYLAYELPEEFNVELSEGEHVLKIFFCHTNADYLRFTKVDNADDTGIEEVNVASTDRARCYNMAGQELVRPMKGVVVRDGKKTVVK